MSQSDSAAFRSAAVGLAVLGDFVLRGNGGVQRFGGGLLMVVGVLMVTGLWEGIMSWVQAHLVTGFQTPL